jgi:hypothetical protein
MIFEIISRKIFRPILAMLRSRWHMAYPMLNPLTRYEYFVIEDEVSKIFR